MSIEYGTSQETELKHKKSQSVSKSNSIIDYTDAHDQDK